MKTLKLFLFIFLLKYIGCEPEVIIPKDFETLPARAVHPAVFAPVLFPCGECVKLIDSYVKKSWKAEIENAKVPTFLSFCESLEIEQDPKYNSSTYKYCLDLHSRMLDGRKQTGVNKPDYTPYEQDSPEHFFLFYRHECEKFNDLPSTQCYTGFCDKYLQCIDCPSGFNIIDNQYNYELQVCSGHGICRLGWLNDRGKKGGNGFCECYEGRKGLACDQIIGEGNAKLPENRIAIRKMPNADKEWVDKINLKQSEMLSERKKLQDLDQGNFGPSENLNNERFLS